MWGIDFLYYLTAPVQGVFILLSILLFIPGFRRKIRSLVDLLPLALWGESRRVWLTRGLLVLVALGSFIVLSSARHLLGDGYLYLRELDSGTWTRADRAPLTFELIRFLHRAGNTLWQTAENTYRVYSYASGLLYMLVAFATANALGREDREKSVVFAFLVTAGYVQLFFGYVENYAFYMPACLLFLLTGIRCLESRAPLYVPALLLGLLIPLHFFFVLFAPSLLFLGYKCYRRAAASTTSWKTHVLSSPPCPPHLLSRCWSCGPWTSNSPLSWTGWGTQTTFSRCLPIPTFTRLTASSPSPISSTL